MDKNTKRLYITTAVVVGAVVACALTGQFLIANILMVPLAALSSIALGVTLHNFESRNRHGH